MVKPRRPASISAAASTPDRATRSAGLKRGHGQAQAAADAASASLQSSKNNEAGTDKRSLRSQAEGAKLKSELALYFADYQCVMDGDDDHDDPAGADGLTVDTVLCLQGSVDATDLDRPVTSTAMTGLDELDPDNFRVIDFSSVEIARDKQSIDPLPDSVYTQAHRREQRREKQQRNQEKERAMHDKAHLEQILERLRGHDWWRVLGLNHAVGPAEVKPYQRKRDHFVREVEKLLAKFRNWKEEEKRILSGKGLDIVDGTKGEAAAVNTKKPTRGRWKARPQSQLQPSSPERPFVSFYAEETRHLKPVTAFGHAVPMLDEQDFSLPDDYFDADEMRDRARKRRRLKRESRLP